MQRQKKCSGYKKAPFCPVSTQSCEVIVIETHLSALLFLSVDILLFSMHPEFMGMRYPFIWFLLQNSRLLMSSMDTLAQFIFGACIWIERSRVSLRMFPCPSLVCFSTRACVGDYSASSVCVHIAQRTLARARNAGSTPEVACCRLCYSSRVTGLLIPRRVYSEGNPRPCLVSRPPPMAP